MMVLSLVGLQMIFLFYYFLSFTGDFPPKVGIL